MNEHVNMVWFFVLGEGEVGGGGLGLGNPWLFDRPGRQSGTKIIANINKLDSKKHKVRFQNLLGKGRLRGNKYLSLPDKHPFTRLG